MSKESHIESHLYQKGLDDAWEAAKKLYQFDPSNNKQLCEELFDCNFNEMICTISPSEAIAKIKEYDEKQRANDEINVGDEVKEKDAGLGVVIRINPYYKELVCVMWLSGGSGYHKKKELTKTGRNFSQIEEVLNKLKEDNDKCESEDKE